LSPRMGRGAEAELTRDSSPGARWRSARRFVSEVARRYWRSVRYS
jgi:hypothetical protein